MRQLRFSQTYENSVQFTIESTRSVDTQRCSVNLMANYDSALFEFDMTNNRNTSCCFIVSKRAEAVLSASISSPSSDGIKINSTDFFSLTYFYTNIGNGSTPLVSTWTDNFYLFNQSQAKLSDLLTNGVLIGSKIQSNLIIDCESNSNAFTLNMQIPFRVSGTWFGFLLDLNLQRLPAQSIVHSELSFEIIKTEPCDLEVTNATLVNPSETILIDAGQDITFSFDVYNVGLGR